MSLHFLLEIGTEEIPHWMIPSALDQIRAWELFGSTPQVDATPRRLVIRAENLPERTPDQDLIVKGPSVAAGEKAARGFAKKNGVELSALTKAGDYYELRKTVPGRATAEILAERLPALILGLQWPKTMYWTTSEVRLGQAPMGTESAGWPSASADEAAKIKAKPPGEQIYIRELPNGTRYFAYKSPRFIRPIRWIVALLNDQVIDFEIPGVKTGNVTRGHRKLGASAIAVTPANYEHELRKNFVILSAFERREKIQKEIAALGAKPDADLLETLTFITEYPAAIKGDFDPAYLTLPNEVLTTVMRHHQKYFSVESAPGKLANHFVAVMNTAGDPEGLVKKGNERVLRARFNDARFFFDVDQQKKLVDRVEDLAKVTFQAKLGSYKEKTERVVALVKELGGSADAQRAALLSKCDLPTEMVKEFTDLQGLVGGLYARHQGESEAVSQAIYEHYKPLSMEDSIPSTLDGQILALADKLDTLRGCFKVGLIPSGSKDPFALRRAAQGVVKILVEGKLNYRLEDLVDGELRAFMLERIQYYFREVRRFKYDEVNAVLASGCGKVADVESRLEALAAVRPTEDFEPLAASFKRISNILKQAEFKPSAGLNAQLLEAGPESDLHADFERVRKSIQGVGYSQALGAIATLRPKVDAFFDKVLVNAMDEKVRANRLTLLHSLLTEFSTIADFSEIVTSGEKQ